MKRFPEGFIYGGATAAYQCEGETLTHGKGKVAWDDFLAEKGRFLGDPASDFYNRYGEDLELCERFGINGIRVSIAWSRIFPEGAGAVNPEGVEFYNNVFAECRRRGVEPFVTLHHFDTPAALYDDGDFLNRAAVDAFVEYARFCFAEYADDVTYWFTFNEIWAVATNQYIEGVWPRGHQARLDLAFQCEHNMMVAHARAVNLYKEMGYGGKIGTSTPWSTSTRSTPIALPISRRRRTRTCCRTSSCSTPPSTVPTPPSPSLWPSASAP
ncbi:family 1 glycosylhydrolase [Granulimonas faecalis]